MDYKFWLFIVVAFAIGYWMGWNRIKRLIYIGPDENKYKTSLLGLLVKK